MIGIKTPHRKHKSQLCGAHHSNWPSDLKQKWYTRKYTIFWLNYSWPFMWYIPLLLWVFFNWRNTSWLGVEKFSQIVVMEHSKQKGSQHIKGPEKLGQKRFFPCVPYCLRSFRPFETCEQAFSIFMAYSTAEHNIVSRLPVAFFSQDRSSGFLSELSAISSGHSSFLHLFIQKFPSCRSMNIWCTGWIFQTLL